MVGEGDFLELTLRKRELFQRILWDFVNHAAGRLRQLGIDPRVILIAFE